MNVVLPSGNVNVSFPFQNSAWESAAQQVQSDVIKKGKNAH